MADPGSLRARDQAYHLLFVARAALATVMVTVALCGALSDRIGLFNHQSAQLNLAYIVQLSTLIAFLFAAWWRIPWYLCAAILTALYRLSSHEGQSAEIAQFATTSIAAASGFMVRRLSTLRIQAVPLFKTWHLDDSINSDTNEGPGNSEELRSRILLLQHDLDHAEARAEELAARNAHLEEFTTSASHDLKSPLRAIRGFGCALLEDYAGELAPRAAGYVEHMLSAAQRLEHVVEALLELGRVSRGVVCAEPLDLAALAREIVGEFRATCQERRVELIAPDRIEAFGDPTLVRIAMTNMLSNAWKFTSRRPDARIEVGTDSRDNAAAFYVRDNGVGFDDDKAPAIFRPFERLHSVRDFDGSGIGLATVERVIERHGGRVWAHGAENHGATVYFTLPRRP